MFCATPWMTDPECGNETVVDSEGVTVADCAIFGPGITQERNQAHARAVSAIPEFVKLAREVAKEYTDAADWKDAIGLIQDLAWDALRKAQLDLDPSN